MSLQIEAIEKRIYKLKLELIKEAAERELELAKINQRALAAIGVGEIPTLPGSTTQLFPGYQPPPTGEITAWQSFWEDVEYSIGEDGRDLLEGAFEGILGELNEFVGGIIDIGADIASGNFYSAGINIAGWFADTLIPTRDIAEENAAAFERMTSAMERNLSVMNRWTDQMVQDRITFLELMYSMRQAGYDEYYQVYLDEIEALNELLQDREAIRGIESLQDLIDYITGADDLDFQTGRRLIDYFTNMFDLTAEQQMALYELLGGLIDDAGGWTIETWMQFNEILDRLNEASSDAADVIRNINMADVGGIGVGDQIYRSITTFTQTQANAMQAILNSIHFDTSALVQIAGQIAAVL